MFAAYAQLDFGTGRSPALGGDFHQFADAFLIERHERIGGQYAARGIPAKERGGVVARDAERRLGEVIGAE